MSDVRYCPISWRVAEFRVIAYEPGCKPHAGELCGVGLDQNPDAPALINRMYASQAPPQFEGTRRIYPVTYRLCDCGSRNGQRDTIFLRETTAKFSIGILIDWLPDGGFLFISNEVSFRRNLFSVSRGCETERSRPLTRHESAMTIAKWRQVSVCVHNPRSLRDKVAVIATKPYLHGSPPADPRGEHRRRKTYVDTCSLV